MTSSVGHLYQYTLDSVGNVVQVRYPDGVTRQYLYNEGTYTSGADLPKALTGIVDEKGLRFAPLRTTAMEPLAIQSTQVELNTTTPQSIA